MGFLDMTFKDAINSGDWVLVFPKPGQWLGKAIRKFTFGEVSHAAIVVDKEHLFETDGDIGKAIFTTPEKYESRRVVIISPRSLLSKKAQLLDQCNEMLGKPYSYWDIITNATFFWLAAPIRRKVVSFFGSKAHMVCSELVARITYVVGRNEELEDFEGITPEDLRDIALEHPDKYYYTEYDFSKK